MAGITHIVLFQFNEHVGTETVDDVVARMFRLKNECIHPDTGKPYILSSRGGHDNSVEGRENGITHAFVVEFANAEDRDYYTFKEPAHLKFIDSLKDIAKQVVVVDFSNNSF
ncbi:hypothetical protein FSARC_7829 [Fusarium sarcochroum]|uniref:Stress-response A/B barrel domain-containing protein n=1 Tax=Fusarium sarcochroum TaxID=1208366 RepID=A0A8H4TUD8_9HYPO|nr:hypothetical protein FSARC_7829 [Fusarium sarcochroum]